MLSIESRRPWENGYCESCNGKPRDECVNQEILDGLKEARTVTNQWCNQYNIAHPMALKRSPEICVC